MTTVTSTPSKFGVLLPVILTGLVLTLLVGGVIIQARGDPMALVRVGTRYSDQDPAGTDGYDGQFVYYIARNPDPGKIAPYLDAPAYRYQRILLPVLVRILSLGSPQVLPWMLALVGILTQTLGTWAVARLLAAWEISPWYALTYGLWAGLTLSVRLDLPEPLAFCLVACGILASTRNRSLLCWILFSLAVFAKEVVVLFVGALLISEALQRNWRSVFMGVLVSLLPFALFQLWLWHTFGQPGLGSGGAMATPFEWVPYLGFLKIGAYSILYLLAMSIVFVPAIILPSWWGIWSALKNFLSGDKSMIGLSLILNGAVIAFLPFSTFRETGGLLRFASGLIFSLLLFAGAQKHRRALNYSLFWLVLNVFLFK